MDSKRTLLDIFHVSESYKLPDAIMDALLSDNAESIIRLVKKSTHDDIRDIFQQEQGDRKTLKHFVLDWHEKEEEQRYVVNAVKAVDDEIELTEMQIEKEKEMKKWYLAKMMAQQNQTPT